MCVRQSEFIDYSDGRRGLEHSLYDSSLEEDGDGEEAVMMKIKCPY